jgi:DNA modification methylase
VPELLIRQMGKGECVLDPFSGSMTTGRTAHRYGLRSISIEMQKEYSDLGIRLLEGENPRANGSPKPQQSSGKQDCQMFFEFG